MHVVLDLSGSVLRVVGFRRRNPVKWAELPLATDGSPPAPEAIQELLATAGLRPRRADVVLPATIGMVRVISLPPVPTRHLRRLLSREVQSLLGLSPQELDATWVPIRKPGGSGLDVVLFLFNRAALERYLAPLRAAGIRPAGLYSLPATLRPALPGPEGSVAHLAEDGSLTLAAFSGGLPRLVQNSFVQPGAMAAQEVARGLRAVRNQAGLPPESLVAVTGPGVGPELRAELQAIGLSPAGLPELPRAPGDWPLDAYLACLGALPAKGLPALPHNPRPFDDRMERANRRAAAFVLAAVMLAAAGELGRLGLWLQVQELEEELVRQGDRIRPYAGAEALVDAVLARREQIAALERDLSAVPPDPVDWLSLTSPLLQRATLTGISLNRANSTANPGRGAQVARELEVTGTAPTLNHLDLFLAHLGDKPFAGAYLTQFQVEETGAVTFTTRVLLEGGEER